MWEEEEKEEEESPLSSPSLSTVSNTNTVSNEQTPASLGGEETSDELQSNFESRSDLLGQIHTESSVDTTNQTPETPASLGKTIDECVKSGGGNPKWSNKLLMKAMGIEEETPSDTAETREEEDTSPSLSSSSNIDTVVDKDNRMIRLFESITINDDDPDSDDSRWIKDYLFRIMNTEDPVELSADQQNDESIWFERCKQHKSDATLFKLPQRLDNCPICHIQLPYLSSGKVYMSCCGRVICRGCIHTIQEESDDFGSLCFLCKVPMPDSNEEVIKRYIKRIVHNHDRSAQTALGCFYQSGMFGLPQSYSKAFNLYYGAAFLGSAEAYCNIADAYDNGRGVERDYEKAWFYYESAATRGNVQARYNLGVSEMLVGNTERAFQHFMIAVKTGCHNESLMKIKQLNMNLHATGKEYFEALRAYNAYLFKIESPRRDKAAAFSNDYRYYEPLRGKVREEAKRVEEKIPDGVKQDDIRLVMSQTGVSRKRAIKALVENDCDCINAIMSLPV